MLLTQNDTPIFKYIVKFLGLIMQGLYFLVSSVGIPNIALCIILFTFVVKLILLPFTIKQQKTSKLQAVITPQVQAIQEKYKDKKDQQSQLAMQEETKQVYEKYGTSQMAGCLQLLIQMPILFALYRVIMNVAAYVPKIKALYTSIINLLSVDYINETFDLSIDSVSDLSSTQINSIVDILSGATRDGTAFTISDWTALIEKFPAAETFYESITSINSIGFGMDIAQSPSDMFSNGIYIAVIIPILAALFQYLSTKVASKKSEQANADNPQMQSMNQSMKMMNIMMPLMSAYFCWSFASGIGVYWICSALFQLIQTVVIHKRFDRIDVEEILAKNADKAEKKQKKRQEKQGIYEEQVRKAATMNTKTIAQRAHIPENTAQASSDGDKTGGNESAKTESGTGVGQEKAKTAGGKRKSKNSESGGQTGSGSSGGIAAKAGLVSEYNAKNQKGRKK